MIAEGGVDVVVSRGVQELGSVLSLYQLGGHPDSQVISSLIAIDELIAYIAITRCHANEEKLWLVDDFLEEIQNRLYDVAYHVANPLTKVSPHKVDELLHPDSFPDSFIRAVEMKSDEMYMQIPVLRKFILPGGCKTASCLHVCRTLSRKIERKIVLLLERHDLIRNVYRYMNRLSDLFYGSARYSSRTCGVPDKKYRKK